MGSASADVTTADAGFSACGHYRWWLWRQWQPQRPALVFIGLNPSRADGERDDPTLRRIVGFAKAWGYGSVIVLNLFARISPSPAVLWRCRDPVGCDNDRWLRRVLAATDPMAPWPGPAAVWLGWGNHGRRRGRHRQVLDLLQSAAPGGAVLALDFTAQGQPRHPLYAPAATKPLLLSSALTASPLAQSARPGAFCGHRADQPWPAPRVATPSICT